MNLHLETLFCDPNSTDPQTTTNAPQQALDDKLTLINNDDDDDHIGRVMVVDEETVAHLAQCTVCFGSEADVELMNCGDQMCFACLEQYHTLTIVDIIRYLEYSLRSLSFGIQPVVIECPLCKCPMEAEDWEPVHIFVNQHIIYIVVR